MGKWLNQIKSKKTGNVYDVLARGIENWEKRRALSVEGTFSDRVRTVAGDDSIKSDEPARVVSIFARTDFSATKLVITQFNQLDMATARVVIKTNVVSFEILMALIFYCYES